MKDPKDLKRVMLTPSPSTPNTLIVGVNRACSFRVHIDVREFDVQRVKTLLNRYKQNEVIIDNLMPESRRGDTPLLRSVNNMVRDLSSYTTPSQICRAFVDMSEQPFKVSFADYDSLGTVAFNHHSGTMNVYKVINWIKLCHNLVENYCFKSNST